MVKINLMGTEEGGAREPEEVPSTSELKTEGEVLSPVPEEDIENLGSPEKKSWLLPVLGVVGLAAALVVLWIILQGRGKRVAPQVPKTTPEVAEAGAGTTQTRVAAETPAELTKTATEAAAETSVPGAEVRTATPSFAEEVVSPTVAAVNDAKRALSVDLGGASLGLFSRSDGEVVVELLGASEAELAAARQAFVGAFPRSNLKLQTESTTEIGGRTYRREIFRVGLPSGAVEAPAQVRYLDRKQLADELRRLARKAGLAVKGLNFAPEVEESQLVKTPVRFKAIGRREAVSAFLDAVANARWNVRITKLLLVPADWQRSVRDRLLTLMVQMDLCQPM